MRLVPDTIYYARSRYGTGRGTVKHIFRDGNRVLIKQDWNGSEVSWAASFWERFEDDKGKG